MKLCSTFGEFCKAAFFEGREELQSHWNRQADKEEVVGEGCRYAEYPDVRYEEQCSVVSK